MFQITRKVFVDLTILMMGFGILIGVMFPFFLILAGVPSDITLTPRFFLLCVGAGLLLGAINISLARFVIGARLKLLTDRMSYIDKSLKGLTLKDSILDEEPDNYFVKIYSEDELGTTADAFNSLVETLFVSLKSETSMRKYTEMLTSNLDIDSLSKEALLQLASIAGSEYGVILLELKDEMKVLASLGFKNTSLILKNESFLRVYKNQKQFNSFILDKTLINTELEQFNSKELIMEPIKYKNEQIGAIALLSETEFSKELKDRLPLYSQSLALALNNALTHNQTKKLATRDSLTNSYNRRFGMELLNQEFTHAHHLGISLTILMLDVDYFKKVNDTYGHSVGDKVLCEITNIVHSVLRDKDIFLRYGGEEFIAILKNVSNKDVYKIAERIRKLIEEKSISCCNKKITISIGVASIPNPDIKSSQQLIDCADKALYSAKNSGRNKVVIYDDKLSILSS